MPLGKRRVPEGTVEATGGRIVKILGFLLLILAKLCWLSRWKVLAWRQGLVSVPQKTHKFNKPSNIHKNAKILYIHHFSFFMKVNHLDVVSRYTDAAQGGDAHWRLYRLPVVTGRAEPQEGGGIARACIEDPKVYPVYQCHKDSAGCLRGQWWIQAPVLIKFWGFCC